mmetsp:Transcript_34049/g.70292  ORF Transcript_34049/g.70292 Transcript_34049/m.70292 type:complete len:291 (-) Transcript_34049:534-1406(-)
MDAVRLQDVPRSGPLPPKLLLQHPKGGSVEVASHGAHLLSWKIPGRSPVIYMSPLAKMGEDDAIRGGIPVCFPQFGPRGKLPQHGFCRKSNDWELASAGDDGSKVEFLLRDNEATRASSWPHPFELRYTMELDDEGALSTALRVRNTGPSPFTFTCALHTYFCVEDVKETTVEGLEGVTYEDNLTPDEAPKQQATPLISFAGEVDRVYGPTPPVLRIVDGKAGRCIAIANDFPDAVVWNPWVEKAKALGDLPDDHFLNFVCVEVGAVREAVEVKAGEEWTASQKMSVSGN